MIMDPLDLELQDARLEFAKKQREVSEWKIIMESMKQNDQWDDISVYQTGASLNKRVFMDVHIFVSACHLNTEV